MALRFSALVFGVAACAVCAMPAGAQQPAAPGLPPQEPRLIIDPGMHTAVIKRIGVDAACTLVATGSDDKTVRLWRLPEGKLLSTLRPPIGPGNDGKVFAVAMAPDGSWVAAGGWDAEWTVSRQMYVYIFQTATGGVMARLGPLGNVINHLTVSPDGRYLAASLWGGQGLRVWERTGAGLTSWQLVTDDKDYAGQDSYGADFDRTGALYTVADDGKLRRYAPGYRAKPTAVVVRGGKRPHSVAAHPAGDRVAVSFNDTTAIEVYDTATLGWRFAADTKGVDNGDLSKVAWSADGARLYAAGRFYKNGRTPLRLWDRAGAGKAQDLEGPLNTIMHLLPCGNDIAMASFDPAFGLIAPNGSRRLWLDSLQADMRGKRFEHFTVSGDGARVRFGLKEWSGDPVVFDLAAERLSDAPAPVAGLSTADTQGLPVTDWINTLNPKLAGAPINLEQHERARAFAIAPDKQRFVLGAEWSLRGYDKDGKALWSKQVPGVVWGANIPRDGTVVVAAYGDGTIRWYRLQDGQELLALFVHAKDRRWVAWTPKGYYMASPGAEGLIGWHVNRGWSEAAEFFSADRFRDQFNRPDIVKGVLAALDEGKAIEEANSRANLKRGTEDVRALAPPVVVIQKPQDEASFRTPEVTLEYFALSPTGNRITDIDVRINNSALTARAAIPLTRRGDEPIRLTLTLPREDVVVTLVAREGNRASQPASIRLRWDGAKPGEMQLPRLRALFVGVNGYASPNLSKLNFAAKDARDLGAFFTAQQGKTYAKVEARVLPDAKRADVLEGLEWLEKGSQEGDVNLLFLAGHGVTDEQQHFYYMAADSDPEKARATGVSRDEIVRTIRNRKGAMVVMLDACHSGASADAAPTVPSRVDMNKLANELGDKTLGVFLYASALGRQFSYEHALWGNGAFTKAMIEGLSGAADREKLGYVDTEELSLYVRRRVLGLTKSLQEPVRMKPDAAPEMRLVSLK